MDPAPSPTPEPQVIDEDLPCPKCRYNLRGLTVPRCPECGFQFEWTDVPELRTREASRIDPVVRIVLMALTILLVAAVFFSAGRPWEILLGMAVITACVSAFLGVLALQALIELIAAWQAIGRPTKRRFLAWWPGAFICDAATNITLLIGGFAFIPFERYGFWSDNLRAWPWLCLAFVESVLIQWWVVGRRLRQWDEPVDARCLLLGCCAAKLAVAVPALYLVQYIRPL